jgi:cell wall-associated NlpC family hydrolase
LAKIRLIILLAAGICLLFAQQGCRSRRVLVSVITGGATGPLSKQEIRQVIETARSYTGTPYSTGGTSRSGMDCSGLVSVSFLAAGRQLPRISYQQAEAGREVTLKELSPGDLVFFTDRKGNNQITHVGIVTEVKDPDVLRFIHASNSLGVVENNLKQRYWTALFLKGVRIQ